LSTILLLMQLLSGGWTQGRTGFGPADGWENCLSSVDHKPQQYSIPGRIRLRRGRISRC